MKKETYNFLEGEILLINKPLTWTSFDVVNKVRYMIKDKLGIKKIKVGHAGTLDPLATGLMIICTGKKTKEIINYQNDKKTYEAKIQLGIHTASYDLETEIERKMDTSNITFEQVNEIVKSFLGPQQQTPPVFSAKKIQGERAYKKARRGEDVEMKSNSIEVFEFNIIDFKDAILHCHIHCSKGTYIRSMAHDLGKRLSNIGTLIELRRTASGSFELKNAIEIEELKKKIDSSENISSIC